MSRATCWIGCAILVALLILAGSRDGDAARGPVLKTFDYSGNGTLVESFENMQFVVDAIGPPDGRGPRLRVSIDDKPAFKLQLAGEHANGSATIKVVKLDGNEPQIWFEHYTFGAHCCVVAKIATRVGGHWVAVFGGRFDGDGGVEFKDIDGSGVAELIDSDVRFLYAFTSYAGSSAPILLRKLEGNQLVDVTRDLRYRKKVVASLAALESGGPNEEQWHQNGFLGAWVATKALLGEGPAAWAKMLTTYDAKSDWPMDKPTFPEALRDLLLRAGYITDVSAFPLPSASGKR